MWTDIKGHPSRNASQHATSQLPMRFDKVKLCKLSWLPDLLVQKNFFRQCWDWLRSINWPFPMAMWVITRGYHWGTIGIGVNLVCLLYFWVEPRPFSRHMWPFTSPLFSIPCATSRGTPQLGRILLTSMFGGFMVKNGVSLAIPKINGLV